MNPELSISYDRDTGYKSFLEDVFEHEVRSPGLPWEPDPSNWTDIVSCPFKVYQTVGVAKKKIRNIFTLFSITGMGKGQNVSIFSGVDKDKRQLVLDRKID